MIKNSEILASIILMLLLLSGCGQQDNNNVDVSKIQANVNIIRFDKDFYGHPAKELPEIKKKYTYLFSPRIPDSIWVRKMQDSLFARLSKQVKHVFPNMNPYKEPIANVFKHIKYYQPNFKEPRIICLYSDWNYSQRAVYADSLLFLALDNFLGTDNPVYKGVPTYIRHNLTAERIPVEIANSIIERQVKPNKSKTFIAKMIYYGKKLYLLDKFVPNMPDSLKIGYTAKKMQWAIENEENVWEYFIDKKMLYDGKGSLDLRFLNLAPYSKFYSEEDMKSPGRIGQYIGWQIVRAYMKKNEVSLQKLIKTDEEEIFKKSKYKPRK